MMKLKQITLIAMSLLVVGIGTSFGQQTELAELDQLKINQIQVLGTHNSYARPVDPRLSAYADPIFSKMMEKMSTLFPPDKLNSFKEFHPNAMSMSEGLKYDHPPFDVQLDSGIRSLEMDVYYDPTGHRFDKPAGYELLNKMGVSDLAPYQKEDLEKPGFKMLHIADFDFRSHYATFRAGLVALREWSEQHPQHLPIFIMVEAKDKGIPIFPNGAEVLPFDDKAFDQLDAEVVAVLEREKLITPDDVRGNYSTLREAIRSGHWPTVKASRGKFVFLLLPATAGMNLESAYVKDKPNLEKRIMFVQSEPNDSFASFILLDNALVRQEEIQRLVREGYIVRSRSDIETYEAKINDYSRANAAFSSGAQIISTDFFRPGNGYNTSYYVRLPNSKVARRNPVNSMMKKSKDMVSTKR
ncbi:MULTISPECIES: Ca2+-dependent phosphoinositide-specific phospholipase C [Sphingobacterium]|nr:MULTISPECIES: Ca2+-dependent phosphoinositide-specific phospholipase C [Sphingobacterium]WSO14963.1 Ca2+-dependent phosphoinositide-specific phospholipase C [Sphingobacterium paramultivorum]